MIKLFNYLRDFYNIKREDVFLLSYPKSGSTFIRIFLFNYWALSNGNAVLNGFDDLNISMPELGKGNLSKKEFKISPRIIKSHRSWFWMIFRENKIISLDRDIIENIVSFYSYSMTLSNSESEDFEKWIVNNEIFEKRMRFFKSIDKFKSVFKLDFAELQDTDKLIKMIEYLGWKFESDVFSNALEASKRESVKSWPKKHSIEHAKRHTEKFNFVEVEKPVELYNICKKLGKKSGYL